MSNEGSSDSDSEKDESVNKNLPPKNFYRKTFWKRSRPTFPSALFAQPVVQVQGNDGQSRQGRPSKNKPAYLTRNRRFSYIIALTHYVGFLTPIWVIFGTDHLSLTLTSALVLGSTSWVASAFFEIPMGVFADKFGRKLSVTLGLGFCAIGDLALIVLPQTAMDGQLLFVVLMLFQVVAGVGFSMRSGSLEGLLHDTYEAANERTEYSKLSSQMLFLLNVSRVLTVPVGAWLYNLDTDATLSSYTFPYIASVASYLIALTAASMLTEKRSQAQTQQINDVSVGLLSRWLLGQVSETINEMKANTDVIRIVAILGFYAVIGEGNWALYQRYFRDRDIDIGLSGWIFTGLVICMALGSLFVPEIYKRINVMWALIAITGLVSLNVAIMSSQAIWIGIVFLAFIINAFVGPMTLYLHDNAIQNRMSGNHKVTALSLASVAYTVGATIGVWGVGAIADRFGVFEAQVVFAIYGFAIVILMSLWCRNEPLAVLELDHIATHEAIEEEVKPRQRSKSIPDKPNKGDTRS